jgi:outer membrane lipoprotein-sorting protein
MPLNRTLRSCAAAALVALPLFAQTQDPVPRVAPSATSEPVKDAPPSDAEKAINQAIATLSSVSSVSADIEINAELLNERFRIEGEFLKAPEYRVSLRLSVKDLGDASGTMVQVCDGTNLWDFQQIIDSQRISRMSLAPVMKALQSPDADAEFRDQIIARMGFSGPDTLLRGLRKACRFDQKTEKSVEGLPKLWEIRGTWTDLAALTDPNQRAVLPGMPLPPYVPSVVVLWIGQEDGFPYRLALEGRLPSVISEDRDDRLRDASGRPVGRRAPSKDERPSRIVLIYSNVKLGQPIPPERFAFEPPPGIQVDDQTERFASELSEAVTKRAAEKRAEAAKAGPILEDGVTAPRPFDDGAPKAPLSIPGTSNVPPSGPDPIIPKS